MTGTPTPTAPPVSGTQPTYPQAPARPQREGTAWSGWIIFAGIMLMLVGAFQLIAGFVAIFERGYYAVASNGLVLHMDFTTWGWIHLIVGGVNILAGFGVLTAKTWARIWAIFVAGASAVINLGFTSAYPVWTVIMIALDVIVIYALAAHWNEMREEYR